MGLKLNIGAKTVNHGSHPVDEKITIGSGANVPEFETMPEPGEKKHGIVQSAKQEKPPIEIEAGYGDWGSMESAPKDRRITVACNTESQPNKWFYHRVRWVDEGPISGPGWYIAGTEWHRLGDNMAKGWTDDIGHP